MRAGKIRAHIEFVFNGSRFKLFVPSENCHIVFALEDLRCPQPSPAYAALANKNHCKWIDIIWLLNFSRSNISFLQSKQLNLLEMLQKGTQDYPYCNVT